MASTVALRSVSMPTKKELIGGMRHELRTQRERAVKVAASRANDVASGAAGGEDCDGTGGSRSSGASSASRVGSPGSPGAEERQPRPFFKAGGRCSIGSAMPTVLPGPPAGDDGPMLGGGIFPSLHEAVLKAVQRSAPITALPPPITDGGVTKPGLPPQRAPPSNQPAQPQTAAATLWGRFVPWQRPTSYKATAGSAANGLPASNISTAGAAASSALNASAVMVPPPPPKLAGSRRVGRSSITAAPAAAEVAANEEEEEGWDNDLMMELGAAPSANGRCAGEPHQLPPAGSSSAAALLFGVHHLGSRVRC